jgi:hypothetical protein
VVRLATVLKAPSLAAARSYHNAQIVPNNIITRAVICLLVVCALIALLLIVVSCAWEERALCQLAACGTPSPKIAFRWGAHWCRANYVEF